MKTAARTSAKSFLCAFLALLCAISLGLWASSLTSYHVAYATTSSEKQSEADEISANIDALQTCLNEAQAEYERARAAYDDAVAKAEAAAKRSEELKVKIAELQERLSSRVNSMYRSGGGITFLEVLLGSSSFEEFATSWDAIEMISQHDAALVDESKAAREEAEAMLVEQKAQQQRAAQEMQAAQDAQNQISANKAQLEAQLSQVNEEIAVLLAREEQERISAEEAARRESYGNQVATEYEGSVDFSEWVLPTNYYGVTCEFGYSPITYSHNGIDLGASEGTPIYAAGPGTVTYAGWYGTGGLAVIISHGDGVRTIYMHQSEIAASVGQSVWAGSVIGYVGSTGLSTGPHLHFQVEIGGTPINPRNIMAF